MKKKSIKLEYILIGAIILVSLLYLIFKSRDRMHYSVPETEPLKKGELKKIEITKNGKKIFITRSGDIWEIGEERYPADKEKVSKITDIIENFTLTTLVSRSGNDYLYDLDAGKKIGVAGYIGNNPAREFDIGKTASTYDHTFVKIKDNPNVYHAKGSIRDTFDKTIDDLRNKRVLEFNKETVKTVVIKTDGEEFEFTRNFEEIKSENKDKKDKKVQQTEQAVSWVSGNKKGDKKNIESIIDQLSALDCTKFIYDKSIFKDTEEIFSIVVNADKEYFLKIYKKTGEKGDHPAIVKQGKYPFFLSVYNAEAIMKKKEKLFEE